MQEFEFQINYDEKSYTLRKYKGDEKVVIIPEMYGGKPVTILFDGIFAGHDEICSIIFPDTVTDQKIVSFINIIRFGRFCH